MSTTAPPPSSLLPPCSYLPRPERCPSNANVVTAVPRSGWPRSQAAPPSMSATCRFAAAMANADECSLPLSVPALHSCLRGASHSRHNCISQASHSHPKQPSQSGWPSSMLAPAPPEVSCNFYYLRILLLIRRNTPHHTSPRFIRISTN